MADNFVKLNESYKTIEGISVGPVGFVGPVGPGVAVVLQSQLLIDASYTYLQLQLFCGAEPGITRQLQLFELHRQLFMAKAE